MKNDTPHQLHIKVALPYSPLGRFTNGGKGFREKLIESLIKRVAILKPSLKLIGLGAKPIIAEFLEFRLQLIYPLYCRL
jgi:hypothetical protein